ncbi:tRNA 5-methylaminomethyl-2-thiouridylate-methyltransferase [Heterostelium album PN500]|uniref:tRNA-5-taurinomethyluridine 2-sulfurtransferase n=1 Tax=Heterostelium pallidum (strain ATCC 26659 / Pp 5 / PN500) TaxID=670386 RepID=D3BN80_HETP5|nr:tRNA 5-methylaminomethyl-2-thiouridylate-methyltransferase [Heterostelium album PN500]EFA76740.1 tRNA 5-methylaminomethyl-2-thiouridylate-methyltransferase [Heterostelium album PN500]|eukprot:XP_020428872.1 tRNA 5-methylaminomethyl-2-thiouridylate-methyltransferase [Heterostelium album PN500]
MLKSIINLCKFNSNNSGSSIIKRCYSCTTTTATSSSTSISSSSSSDAIETKLSKTIIYPKQSSFSLINKKPEICVGLSGGVDSAVTAYLLKKQGFKVQCVYIKSWDEKDELGYCTGEKDYSDAQDVANRLQLPIYHADFVKEYWNRVFNSFLEEYSQGYTPNPDVFCNREIKFNVFYEYAKSIGADMIATGHYSRLQYDDELESARLLRGVDPNKDQSYFLCMTEGRQLYRSLFPIGDYVKTDIKALANQLGYTNITAKTSSRGICFVGKRPLDEFLGTYINLQPGAFLNPLDQQVGQHKGAICYTIGQKANISGLEERYIVYKIDKDNNCVFVCPESLSKKYLMSQSLQVHRINWINGIPERLLTAGVPMKIRCQVRYRSSLVNGEISLEHLAENPQESVYSVQLEQPERAVAPGQILCIYEPESDVCLGGASVGLVRTLTDVIGPLSSSQSNISFPLFDKNYY